MNKLKWMAGVICILGIALSGIQAFPIQQEDQTKQIEELKKQVVALEQRIAILESKLQKLTLVIPKTFPDLQQLPKGWQKREFNGMEYFIIPIQLEYKKTETEIR